MKIKKRNNKLEELNLNKIHKVLEFACDGIHNVSVSEIELKSQLQFYDNMTTEEIHDTLIKTSAELISEETPNYQYVASRLILFDLKKRVYGDVSPLKLIELVKRNIQKGFYTKDLLDWYSEEEFDHLNKIIRYDRDEKITYIGMEQLRQKYLVKNRYTKEILETPQEAFILVAATIFHKYPKNERMKWVRDFYNALSNFDISLPTPIMAGARTPLKQYSSCTLIDCGDSLNSINATASAIVKYAANRAGIGINVGRIRSLGSKIRDGDATHTGIIPFIKYFSAALKSCNQGGLRVASATLTYPFWHYEFEDLIVLKNNKGTEDTRERAVDYSVQLNKLAYERLIKGENLTFFSPNDVPGLYESFFRDQNEFEKLYVKYENDKSIRKKTLPAIEVFTKIIQERKETGRIYIMHVDHCNTYSSLDEKAAPVYMSNLCQEVLLCTKPLEDINDKDGLIGLCTLAAINIGNIKSPSDFERPAKLLVRALNEILDYQDYPVNAAKTSTDLYRNIGIGMINLAYFLAKHNYKYDSEGVLDFLHPFAEAFSYYIIKESNELAKEQGPCLAVEATKYKKGILPALNYKKTMDEYVKNDLLLDWKTLAKSCKEFGVRNATMINFMPSETSSTVSNSTNGIEPPRALVSIKNSKDGALKQVVPEYQRLKNKYDLLWDQKTPKAYLKICGVLNKFTDQSLSVNTSYNPEFYENNELSMSELLQDLIFSYQIGLKTLYYFNTNDMAGEIDVKKELQQTEIIEEDCDSCKI